MDDLIGQIFIWGLVIAMGVCAAAIVWDFLNDSHKDGI